MSTDSMALPGRYAAGARRVAADPGFSIPSLDGIRAVAVMIVFIAHCGLQHIVPGGFGVTIFFFLSGYLITTLLRREYEQTGTISLRNFYLRRIYRIFPPLYLVLGLLIALHASGLVGGDMSAGAVLAQLLQVTNYYIASFPSVEAAPVVPFTVPFWSLAVEEHFYLLFPLTLLLLLRRKTNVPLLLGGMCAVVLAWRYVLAFTLGNPDHYIYHATDTRIDSLLYGCIMGLWLNPALDAAPRRVSTRGWIALCAAALVLLGVSFLYRSPVFRDTLRYTVQGIALFPLFWCAVRFHRAPVFAWLNTRPVRALGIISYTFYLSHYAAIQLAGKALDTHGVVRGVAGFVLATGFSAACYVLVERRFAVLRRRLHREASPARRTAAAR
ncbi:MAG: acyltransferase family protein [Burkholderiales bacterium]